VKELTLEAILLHPKYPFPDLRDLEQYLMAELYWLFLTKDVLGADVADWTGWLRPCGFPEGGSILSLRKKDRSKGIIIDQQSVAEDLEQYGAVHRPFVVSMATWEDENDSHPMPYLRMFVAISDDTQRIARHFIESWVRVGTSGKDLQDLIDRYYAVP
jgi:hypothetical protein